MESIATLYLDAADLISIADQRVEPELLRRLHETMARQRCALVFTVNHAWDIEAETRERLADALDEFPLVVMPDVEPQVFEGVQPPTDLVLRQVDIRRVLEDRVLDEAIRVADPVVTLEQEAVQLGINAARSTRATPMRKRDIETFMHEVAALVSASQPISKQQVIAVWEARHGENASMEQRAEVVALAHSLARSLNTLRSALGHVDSEQLVAMMRDLPDPGLANAKPGTYVQRCLREARRGDLGRNSKRSDFVDLRHVQFIPYVDIFTTDKENVAVLAAALAKTSIARRAKLLRNRKLDSVVAALEALR